MSGPPLLLYYSITRMINASAVVCAEPHQNIMRTPYNRAFATTCCLCSSDLSGPVGAELFLGAEM